MAIGSIRRPTATNHLFFVGVSLLAVSIGIVGFWPTYLSPLLNGSAQAKSFVVHLHAVVCFGFLLLFVAQIFLVSTGRVALHRKLGNPYLGIVYGMAIVVVGTVTTFASIEAELQDGRILAAQRALLTPFLDMTAFSAFFGAALLYRRKPQIHARLMLVAVTILLDSPATRIEVLPDSARILVWLSPILLGSGYDLIVRRFVHPIYAVGASVIWLMLQRPQIVRSEAWLAFSGWVITLVS